MNGNLMANKDTRTLSAGEEEKEVDLSQLSAEERYIQLGKEYGLDDNDREIFSSIYEVSDESESTVHDYYDSDEDTEESVTEEYSESDDLTASDDFEFEMDYDDPGDFPEEVPMFKQRFHDK